MTHKHLPLFALSLLIPSLALAVGTTPKAAKVEDSHAADRTDAKAARSPSKGARGSKAGAKVTDSKTLASLKESTAQLHSELHDLKDSLARLEQRLDGPANAAAPKGPEASVEAPKADVAEAKDPAASKAEAKPADVIADAKPAEAAKTDSAPKLAEAVKTDAPADAAKADAPSKPAEVAKADKPTEPAPTEAAPEKAKVKTAAKATDAEKVKAPLTDAEKIKIGEDLVRNELSKWTPDGQTLKIRSSILPFPGDASVPVVGSGPIEFYVKQWLPEGTSGLKLFLHKFNRYSNRKFEVTVDDDGVGTILSSVSMAPQYRLARALTFHLPIPELLSDIVNSKQVVQNLTQVVFGGYVALQLPGLGTAAGSAIVASAVANIATAVKAQQTVRSNAMDATVTWAKAMKQAKIDALTSAAADLSSATDKLAAAKPKSGAAKAAKLELESAKAEVADAEQMQEFPRLAQAYAFYRGTLQKLMPGTRPANVRNFSEQLEMGMTTAGLPQGKAKAKGKPKASTATASAN